MLGVLDLLIETRLPQLHQHFREQVRVREDVAWGPRASQIHTRVWCFESVCTRTAFGYTVSVLHKSSRCCLGVCLCDEKKMPYCRLEVLLGIPYLFYIVGVVSGVTFVTKRSYRIVGLKCFWVYRICLHCRCCLGVAFVTKKRYRIVGYELSDSRRVDSYYRYRIAYVQVLEMTMTCCCKCVIVVYPLFWGCLQDVDVAFFAVGWFQTLFLYTSRMPSDTLLWMWDVWLTERSYKVGTTPKSGLENVA